VNEGIPHWSRQIARALSAGFLLVFDYGYEPRELLRFPTGTLLSYHRHRSTANVLDQPGRQDITAHVNFAHLTDSLATEGFALIEKKTLSAWALSVWPEESFAPRWQRASAAWRLQWKQLVFGMGESFHVLLFRKLLTETSAAK
jgi:SAM-dependent MidA family methyltransferase